MTAIPMTKLQEQIASQQALADKIRLLQKEEKELRADILEQLFGTNCLGTLKAEVGNMVVTGTYGQTYSFNQTEIDQALGQGLLSEEAEEAIRIKFEVDKKAYDNLSDEASAELDDYITVKPSLPSIKVKVEAEEE